MTRLPDHRLDPPEQSAREEAIDARVYEMSGDPAKVREWLDDAICDEDVMAKLARLLSRRFDEGSRIAADSFRLDLADQIESWCLAQVEAQAKGEG